MLSMKGFTRSLSSYLRRTCARLGPRTLFLCVLAMVAFGPLPAAHAQAGADSEDGMRIEAIRIEIASPSADEAFNRRVEDAVRRALGKSAERPCSATAPPR